MQSLGIVQIHVAKRAGDGKKEGSVVLIVGGVDVETVQGSAILLR